MAETKSQSSTGNTSFYEDTLFYDTRTSLSEPEHNTRSNESGTLQSFPFSGISSFHANFDSIIPETSTTLSSAAAGQETLPTFHGTNLREFLTRTSHDRNPNLDRWLDSQATNTENVGLSHADADNVGFGPQAQSPQVGEPVPAIWAPDRTNWRTDPPHEVARPPGRLRRPPVLPPLPPNAQDPFLRQPAVSNLERPRPVPRQDSPHEHARAAALMSDANLRGGPRPRNPAMKNRFDVLNREESLE